MSQDMDFAGYRVVDSFTPFKLFIGEAYICTDSAPALAAVAKYQVLALTATGVTPYVVGTHNGQQAVIAAQAGAIGGQIPYWNAGKFNHAVLIWPAGLDTLAKRKAELAGSPLMVGHLIVG